MTKRAILPGSYDPITVGHEDLVRRAAAIYGSATILVSYNPEKSYLFSDEERLAMAKAVADTIPGVDAVLYQGYVAEYAKAHDGVLVKGVRNAEDLDYEYRQYLINREIADMETVFLPSDPDLCGVCSGLVRERIKNRENVKELVPEAVLPLIRKK